MTCLCGIWQIVCWGQRVARLFCPLEVCRSYETWLVHVTDTLLGSKSCSIVLPSGGMPRSWKTWLVYVRHDSDTLLGSKSCSIVLANTQLTVKLGKLGVSQNTQRTQLYCKLGIRHPRKKERKTVTGGQCHKCCSAVGIWQIVCWGQRERVAQMFCPLEVCRWCETCLVYVRHDSFMWQIVCWGQRVARLLCPLEVCLVHVRHDLIIWDMPRSCETWLVHVRHDSFMWDMTRSCETWLVHVRHATFTRDMTHSGDEVDSCETWLIYRLFVGVKELLDCFALWRYASFMWDMTRSCETWLVYVRHAAFTCDMTRSYDVTGSCGTWLIYRHFVGDKRFLDRFYEWVMSHTPRTNKSCQTFGVSVMWCDVLCCAVLCCAVMCCDVMWCDVMCFDAMWCDSFMWDTSLACMRDIICENESCHTHQERMSHVTHTKNEWVSFMWDTSCLCETWLVHGRQESHLYARHDSFMYMYIHIWHIHICLIYMYVISW